VKIECVRTYHLACKLPEPFAFSQWSYGERHAMLVEVIADGGASGWGECYGPAVVCQAAVAFYAPRLLGLDPLATEVVWHRLWQSSLDFARGGVMTAAISGIDIALWDLKGKVLGLPVVELIGGRFRDRVPCYATGMYFRDRPDDERIEQLTAEGRRYGDEGFEAMKIKVGRSIDFDLRLIAAMRDALPDVRLMADSNHAYDLPEAIRVGRALEEANFAWFEEPLAPDHYELYRQLHEKIDVPLAAGECEQTRHGFKRLLDCGGVDFVQPDIAYCGGISEALRIRAMASAAGVNVVPHAWGTMINLAAATHFLASTFVEPGRAEWPALPLEYDRTPNPLRDELFSERLVMEKGWAQVPQRPGLGVLVDPSVLKTHLLSTTELRA